MKLNMARNIMFICISAQLFVSGAIAAKLHPRMYWKERAMRSLARPVAPAGQE